MSLYLFGVTASEVASRELASARNIDADVMTAMVRKAAGDIAVELRNVDVMPSSITESAYPEDYELLRSYLMEGAAAYYLQSVGGSSAAVESRISKFARDLGNLRDRPNILESHTAANSPSVPVSHLTRAPLSERSALQSRIPDPRRRIDYETL